MHNISNTSIQDTLFPSFAIQIEEEKKWMNLIEWHFFHSFIRIQRKTVAFPSIQKREK